MTEPIESRVEALAKEFQYPPTPSVAGAVMTRIDAKATRPLLGRKLAWALTILLVIFAGLMFVPPVRAAVLEFIQIGIVRIFPAPIESPVPTIEAPITVTPAPTKSSLIPILEAIAGETTLESARNIVDFPIPLPTYPADLGEPDRIFVQDAGGWMLILVWLDPQQPNQVQMSLHLIEEGSWTIDKYHPEEVAETTVHGRRALWTDGEYPLMLRNSDIQFMRMIEGHVLIWEENDITYRLEIDVSLEEAIRIAESLQVP
ncbi:MAG: hypothetical protein H7Y59_19405 [Anaerolineales bacterium]|nr:hypothetical protein [Anaerolineales bacterium]